MAAVRHLEFAKIAILVKRPISACNSSSPFRNLHKSANMAPRYGQKTIFNMASVRHLEFEKFRFFCQIFMLGMESCICVPNVIEIEQFMEMKLFSKWRTSAILNVRKLHFCAKFRVDRPIRRRDIAK